MSKDKIKDAQNDKLICFLVGVPRSGTTWMQRLLQTNPHICGGEESHFFTLFGHALQQTDHMYNRPVRKIGPLSYTDRTTFENLLKDLWNGIFEDLYKSHPESIVHLEKTPDHILHLGEISRLFPDARIIVLLRDSRAVVSSLVNAGRGWGGGWAPKSYKQAAILWHRYLSAFVKWKDANPNHPNLVIRYEEALAAPRDTVRQIAEFMGLQIDNDTIEQMFSQYDAERNKIEDPKGFSNFRGEDGWKVDMSIYGKYVTWRYTRKIARRLGYECQLFS